MNVIDTVNHIENKDIHDLLLKFIIVGDSYVGKSNLLLQYTNKKFSECHDITIGVEFGLQTISYMNRTYKVQIWDTAGQETFKALTRNYYRNAIGCLLVYDIGRKESFDNIIGWLDDVKKYSNENIIIVLIGNKSDSERQVSYEEGQEYANNICKKRR
jgi:small GTP-binding protein